MAYNFNNEENEITKLLPAYIFNYSDDNKKGLFLFIKYLTNYIETANKALDTICSELNVNSDNTFILDILAKKLGVEIPTTITSKEDKQTVLKGKIMTLSSTGCAQALIDTIYGLYPDWHNYDSFGTPIEVGDTLEKLFYNTNETPTLGGLGWDNADETTTTTDVDGFETVTKILNVLVSTTGPVVQLVQKTSNGLEGYSVIVHYTTPEGVPGTISYIDNNILNIEDINNEENREYIHLPVIDSSLGPDEYSIDSDGKYTYSVESSIDSYAYLDSASLYLNCTKEIEYSNKWLKCDWNINIDNFDSLSVWTDSENIYYSYGDIQLTLNKQSLMWDNKEWVNKPLELYGYNVWTDTKNIYCSYINSGKLVNYVLEVNVDTGIKNKWVEKEIRGLDDVVTSNSFNTKYIWSDNNNNVYYSYESNQYRLNKTTLEWTKISWSDSNLQLNGSKIIKVNNYIYYFKNNEYYIFDEVSGNTWVKYNWENNIIIDGTYIWSIDNHYYYSNLQQQFRLDTNAFKWESVSWDYSNSGIDVLSNEGIWFCNNIVFYKLSAKLDSSFGAKYINRKKIQNEYIDIYTKEVSPQTRLDITSFSDPNNEPNELYIDTKYIWKDNDIIRSNNSTLTYTLTLNKTTNKWESSDSYKIDYSQNIPASGDKIASVDGAAHYIDGKNYYAKICSSDWDWISYTLYDHIDNTNNITDSSKIWHTLNNTYYDTNYIWEGKLDGSKVWYDGIGNIYSPCRIFDKQNNIWVETDIQSIMSSESDKIENFKDFIWTDNGNTYCSAGSGSYYKLNYTTNKWEHIDILVENSSIFITGKYVWHTADGTTYYSKWDYSSKKLIQYKFDRSRNIWLDWHGGDTAGASGLDGSSLWSDGIDVFYTSLGKTYKFEYDAIWSEVPSNSLIDTGKDVWSDGNNIYYSGVKYDDTTLFPSEHVNYILEKTEIDGVMNYNWTPIDVSDDNYPSNGRYIWKNGSDIYFSSADRIEARTYKLDRITNTWKKVEMRGTLFGGWKSVSFTNIPANFDTKYIWSDNKNVYYSNNNIQLQIDDISKKFIPISWQGELTSFDGDKIWGNDYHIYYSNNDKQYTLDTTSKSWTRIYWSYGDLTNYPIDSNYVWQGYNITYYSILSNSTPLNLIINNPVYMYHSIYTVYGKFINNILSIKIKKEQKYITKPVEPVRLYSDLYDIEIIKILKDHRYGWLLPDNIDTQYIDIEPIVITKEKYQNEWGRYIAKNNEFNPIIKNAVSVIDEGSLLYGAKNMNYRVIIDVPGLKENEEEQTIITKYLIPKFLGVKCEVEFK